MKTSSIAAVVGIALVGATAAWAQSAPDAPKGPPHKPGEHGRMMHDPQRAQQRAKEFCVDRYAHAVGRMASATGFMAIVCYIMILLLPLQASDQSFLATFPKFCVIVAVSLTAYVFLSRLLKLEEAVPVINQAKRILFDRIFPRGPKSR